MKIKIYTTSVCPYCHTLKEFLKEKGVSFEEVDISRDILTQDKLIEKTGKMEVPIIEIGDQLIVGFDRKKLCGLLGIKE